MVKDMSVHVDRRGNSAGYFREDLLNRLKKKGEMSEPETYWMKGTMWFTREDRECQGQVIHARLGAKEAPIEVFRAERYRAVQRERDALKEDLAFLGASRKEDGSLTLEMRKYHAGHRCEKHRSDPWRGIDTEIDYFCCMKEGHDALKRQLSDLADLIQTSQSHTLKSVWMARAWRAFDKAAETLKQEVES